MTTFNREYASLVFLLGVFKSFEFFKSLLLYHLNRQKPLWNMKKRALPKSESSQLSRRLQRNPIPDPVDSVVTFLNFDVVLQKFTNSIYATTRNIEPWTPISSFHKTSTQIPQSIFTIMCIMVSGKTQNPPLWQTTPNLSN